MEIKKIYIQTIIIVMTGFLCACGGKEPEDFSLSGAREEPSLAESREDSDKKGRSHGSSHMAELIRLYR